MNKIGFKMLRLFFISAATHFTTARELNDIMRVARQRNSAEGVSSLLIYNDGSFAQLMEGPNQVVLATMARIEKDQRHSGVAIIVEEEISTRILEGWDMQVVPVSKIAAEDDYDFLSLAAFHASPQYAAVMKHPALRGFLASFKAVAKTQATRPAQHAPAIASEPSISRTAARFLRLYGSSRRYAEHMPIPRIVNRAANDPKRPGSTTAGSA